MVYVSPGQQSVVSLFPLYLRKICQFLGNQIKYTESYKLGEQKFNAIYKNQRHNNNAISGWLEQQ